MNSQKSFKTPTSLKSTIMMLKRTRTNIDQLEEKVANIEKNGFTYIKKFDINECKLTEVIEKATKLLVDRGDIQVFDSWFHGPNSYQCVARANEIQERIADLKNEIAELKSREQFYETLLSDYEERLSNTASDIHSLVGKKYYSLKQLETA